MICEINNTYLRKSVLLIKEQFIITLKLISENFKYGHMYGMCHIMRQLIYIYINKLGINIDGINIDIIVVNVLYIEVEFVINR